MRRIATCLLAVAALGCSGVVGRGDDDLRREVSSLQQRLLDVQRRSAMSEVELARLRRRLAELEAQPAAAPPSGPEPAAPAPPLVEAPGPSTSAPSTSALAVRARVESREVPELVGSVDTDAPGEPVSTAAQALYDRGYTLYHQGQYVEAEASFQRFLEGFAASDLADNSLYWIGEARFSRGDHRGALASFQEAARRYPDGNKVADSLLKAGQCLELLGDPRAARATYQEVQRRFPDTATALIAGERLAGLP